MVKFSEHKPMSDFPYAKCSFILISCAKPQSVIGNPLNRHSLALLLFGVTNGTHKLQSLLLLSNCGDTKVPVGVFAIRYSLSDPDR